MIDRQKTMIPKEMLKAVLHTVLMECGRVDYHPQIRIALESALIWLSENPIVPNDEWILQNCTSNKDEVSWVKDTFFEWQKRMFLAPPEPSISDAAQSVIQRTKGCTFSRADANFIINAVNACVKSSPAVSKDEPIQDLLSKQTDNETHADTLVKAMAKGHNADVREAYRRGRER